MSVTATAAAQAASSPPDWAAIGASFGVFALAVSAVVGGIWKAIRDIRKGGADTGKQVQSAVLVETTTLTQLTEGNRRLTETVSDTLDILKLIERHLDKSVEATREFRDTTRSATEETHRLRVAVTDLHEFMRSQRR